MKLGMISGLAPTANACEAGPGTQALQCESQEPENHVFNGRSGARQEPSHREKLVQGCTNAKRRKPETTFSADVKL